MGINSNNTLPNQVVVITEYDYDHEVKSVLGVADSIENAERLLKEYYEKWEELKHIDGPEGTDMIYIKDILVEGPKDHFYKVTVILTYYFVNTIM